MKVTLLNQSDSSGGAAVACKRLFHALRREGMDVHLLTGEANLPEEAGLVHYPIAPWRYKWLWMQERIRFIPFEKNKSVRFAVSPGTHGLSLRKEALVQQSDILHLHWINKGFLNIEELAKINALGQVVVWTLHDMWAFTGGCHYSGECARYENQCGECVQFLRYPGPKDYTHTIWKRKEKAYKKLNLHIITCSDWLGNMARNSSLLKHASITTIPNPIDTDVFCPAETKQSTTKKTILFQAMNLNDSRKGFKFLAEALQLFYEQHPEWRENVRILLFGKADPLPELPFPIEYLGSLKSTDAIIEAYRQSDVFVIPSLEDNLPNTIMEAMACGVPVVGFKTGGIPEMIEHKASGYVANFMDVEDLKNGIHWVLSDEPRRQTLGAHGRTLALTNYAMPVVAKKIRDYYLSVLNLYA